VSELASELPAFVIPYPLGLPSEWPTTARADRSGRSDLIVVLIESPDRLALPSGRPDRTPAAIEEMMRLDTPLHRLRSTAAMDVELNGVKRRQGCRAVGFLASASRDGTIHRGPDRLDVFRSPRAASSWVTRNASA